MNAEYPVNTYDQVGKGGVLIGSYATPGSRGHGNFSGYQVVRVGFDIDQRPKEQRHWFDPEGAQLFPVWNYDNDKKKCLEAAKEWASNRYGITKWKRNAQYDYIDANAGHVPLRREVEDKEARKAKKANP